MPRRTQVFQKIPWTGGVNTSVDPGVLPTNDLVQADNVQFGTAGTRLKRDGFSFHDTDIPAVIKRSSSGTTRTLQFASGVQLSGPTDQILVVGEKLEITGAGNTAYNNVACIIATVATTTITNDTITYTFSGATSVSESLTVDTGVSITKNYDVLCVHDYWYFNSSSNAKAQYKMAVTSQGLIFRFDTNGKRKQIAKSASGATTLAVTTLTSADMKTFNNRCLIAMSGVGNTPKYFDAMVADEWKDMVGAPDGSIMQEHLERIWMNDKLDPDKLHYCETFDDEKWQGVGDSGALYVGPGDGDPKGISAIYPPFRGALFVAKGTRLRRIEGDAPENFSPQSVSDGVGAVSHRAAVAYDFDDVFFMSERGAHSVIATQQFGDVSAKFLSRKIQNTFNTWSGTRRTFMQGAYLPTLNSVAWCVAEDGQTSASALWLYNPTIGGEDGSPGEWYRWPNLGAQSICTVLEDGVRRFMCGTNEGRILLGQTGDYTDFGDQAINYRIKSGHIYVDGNPQTIKAYKKFGLLFKPRGRFSFTAYFKVDNLPKQAIEFHQNVRGDRLGEDFYLGQSLVGSNNVLAPFMKDVVGHGRGVEIEIFQSGTNAQVEIYGFLIEYESADIADEVTSEQQ